jgi:hypothetical protein
MYSRLVFISLAALSSFAFAAKKAQTEPAVDPNVDQSYSVPVQATGVEITTSREEYNPSAIDYAISTSSWLPGSFNRPSLLSTNSNFGEASLPQITIARIAPVTFALGGIIESEMGVSYAQLSRTGLLDTGSGPASATETLNVTSLKVGAAYRRPSLGTRYLQPSIELSLLPTWISGQKSEFEANGVSAVGVIFEGSLSLLYCPDFMQKGNGLSYKNTGEGFGVGYTQTVGSVGGSDLSGGGLQAILRMSL